MKDKTITFKSLIHPYIILKLGLRLALVLFVCILSFTVSGQALFPVTASLDIQQPYSPLFYTFGDPSPQAFRPNKVALRMRLNDLNEASLTVQLKWEVSGPGIDFATSDDLVGSFVDLLPGQFLTFDNASLSEYFDAMSSEGLSRNDVDQNGGYLPEGMYTFCVTAYDIARGQQVSNTTCRTIYIEEYEPPMLNAPFGEVEATFPQNINVSWTPMHFGSFPVIYNVKVWEDVEGLSPDLIVSSSMPLVTYDVPQVTQSYINASHPFLIPGQRYWVQVQVRDNISGPVGLPSVIFKNNGNSEVLEFIYGGVGEQLPCEPPVELIYELDHNNHVLLEWLGNDVEIGGVSQVRSQLGPQGFSGNTEAVANSTLAYLIKYRLLDTEDPWEQIETTNKNYELSGLRRGKTYEIQVFKVCTSGVVEGPMIVVRLPKVPKAKPTDCGALVDLSGASDVPLDELVSGDTIVISEAHVIIESVSGSGGVFSGSGYITMPILSTARLAVEFNAITVNEEYLVTDGEIETVYNENSGNVVGLNFGNNDVSDFQEITFRDSFAVLGVNANGTLVYVDGDTMTITGGAYVSGMGLNQFVFNGQLFEQFDEYEILDSVGSIRIEFTAASDQKYGFDGYKNKIKDEYEKYEDLSISYKSIAEGQFDYVVAEITKGEVAESDELFFVDGQTMSVLEYTYEGNGRFKVQALGLGSESEVIAFTHEEGIAGKLKVYSRTITRVQVNVINVNGASNLNISSAQSATNKLLDQGLFRVTLNEGGNFNYAADEDGVVNVENHFLNAYSPDMKKLADAYFDQYGSAENEFYLFICDNLELGTAGLMPQGYAAGFISGGSFNATTIAHELSHGIFNMSHAWQMYDGVTEKSSTNLMDYNDGGELWYKQWKQMASPGFPKGWRKDEEDGKKLGDGFCWLPYEITPFLVGKSTYLLAGGTAFTLPDGAIPKAFSGNPQSEDFGSLLMVDYLEEIYVSFFDSLSGEFNNFSLQTCRDLKGEERKACIEDNALPFTEGLEANAIRVEIYEDKDEVVVTGEEGPIDVQDCSCSEPTQSYENTFTKAVVENQNALLLFKEQLDKIFELYERCNGSNWESYEGNGIVPYCLWEYADNGFLNYSGADPAYMSGIVDGVYSMIYGVGQLPGLILDLDQGLKQVTYAYTMGALKCWGYDEDLGKEELAELIEKLEIDKENEDIIPWLHDVLVDFSVEQKGASNENCDEVIATQASVSEFIDFISSMDSLKVVGSKLWTSVIEYLDKIEGVENEARFHHGKIALEAAEFIIPILKSQKISGFISKLKNLSARQIREAGKEAAERIKRGGAGLLDDLGAGLTKLKAKGVPDADIRKIHEKLGSNEILDKLADQVDDIGDDIINDLIGDLLSSEGDDLLRKLGEVDVEGGGKIVQSWKVVSHLDPKIRLNPDILERISTIRTAGKIPVENFDNALNSHLGDIFNSVDELEINNILDVLYKNHVNAEHFEKITNRLNKYPDLKKDFVDNPSWFETFDDILENPSRYNEIFKGADVPNKAELRKWANGFWKKEYFRLADDFEADVVPSLFRQVNLLQPENILTQITIDVKGVKIRLDYIGRDPFTGKWFLGDAKFSTKDKNWLADWLNASTPNQQIVYPKFQNNEIIEVTIKATDLNKISQIKQAFNLDDLSTPIKFEDIESLKIFGSEANQLAIKGNPIELINK